MAQIGYFIIGTNDLPRAVAFYDALLGELGGYHFIETDRAVSYSFGPGTSSLSVSIPENGQPATVGNGVMAAIGVGDRKQVDSSYQQAIELGATSEGKPGPRGDAGFYAGYFRDLDGNKLNVFCIERAG